LVDEPAPIIPAFTPEQVAERVVLALDPVWRADWVDKARHWTDHHHHHDIVTARHREAFDALMLKRPRLKSAPDRHRTRLDEMTRQHLYDPSDVVLYDYWKNAGATLQLGPAGAAVLCPPGSGQYASAIILDFSGIDFSVEHAWVRVVLADVHGELGVSLYEPEDNLLTTEKFLRSSGATHEVLLLRNGENGQRARAVLVQAELLRAPRMKQSAMAA
jgi:hypothetical protein